MKWILMDEVNGDVFTEESDDREALLKKADAEWEHLSDADKNRRTSFCVIESINPDEDAENHFDGNVIERWK